MTAPVAGPVDAAVVDDVIGTLRAARWQRRDAAARVLPPGSERATLIIDGKQSLRIGPDVAGGAWIAVADRAYLMESWVIAAIDRSAVDLRIVAPLASAAAGATGVEIHAYGYDLVASGRPLAATMTIGELRLDPKVAAELLTALAEIRIVSLAPVPDQRPQETIRVIGPVTAELELHGWCSTRDAATASTGTA